MSSLSTSFRPLITHATQINPLGSPVIKSLSSTISTEECSNLAVFIDGVKDKFNEQTDALSIFLNQSNDEISKWHDHFTRELNQICSPPKDGIENDPFSPLSKLSQGFQETINTVFDNNKILMEKLNQISECLKINQAISSK